MYTGQMQSIPYCRQIIKKPEFSRQFFEKSSDAKFHGNPSTESRVVPCERTDGRTDGQTDTTKQIFSFHNLVNGAEKKKGRDKRKWFEHHKESSPCMDIQFSEFNSVNTRTRRRKLPSRKCVIALVTTVRAFNLASRVGARKINP